jgi:hypothetical protein
MVGLPNGERTGNNPRPISIEWASLACGLVRTTEERNRLHRFTKADGPQLDIDRCPVVHDLDI